MEEKENILFAPPLSQLSIPPSVLNAISPEKASELCVLPLARHHDVVVFAVRDVHDEQALMKLRHATDCVIFPMQAREKEIREAITRHYDPTYAARQEKEQHYQQRLEKMMSVCHEADDFDSSDGLFRIVLLDALRRHASLVTWRMRADGLLLIFYQIEGQDHEAMRPPLTLRDHLLHSVYKLTPLSEDSEEPLVQGSITLTDEEGAFPPLAIVVDQTAMVQRPPLEPIDEEQIRRVDGWIEWEQTFDSLAQKLLFVILGEAYAGRACRILLEQGDKYMYVYHLTDEKKRLVRQPAGAMFPRVLQEIKDRAEPREKVGFWKRLFGLQAKPSTEEPRSGAFRFNVAEISFRIAFSVSSFRGRQFVLLTVSDLENLWGIVDEETLS